MIFSIATPWLGTDDALYDGGPGGRRAPPAAASLGLVAVGRIRRLRDREDQAGGWRAMGDLGGAGRRGRRRGVPGQTAGS